MAFQLPKVYPITNVGLAGISHAEQVARLIDGGATLIQLREKNVLPKDFLHSAEAALAVAKMKGVAIIINDRVDIAMALNATGVHLGQFDMPVDAARRLLPKSIIGISTHNLSQVEVAVRLPVDYIAFGPVFATSTKADREPFVGLDLLRQAKQIAADIPVVAIGGITPANCRQTLKAGADSVAVISALVADAAKIAENTRQMLALVGL